MRTCTKMILLASIMLLLPTAVFADWGGSINISTGGPMGFNVGDSFSYSVEMTQASITNEETGETVTFPGGPSPDEDGTMSWSKILGEELGTDDEIRWFRITLVIDPLNESTDNVTVVEQEIGNAGNIQIASGYGSPQN